MRIAKSESRQKFILAAIEELQQHGISDFSMRRVASACGVSCGAPYRHFESKSILILEVIAYINSLWKNIQEQIISEYKSVRENIVNISVAYVRFLCDNPEFYSVLLLNDKSMNTEQLAEKSKISTVSEELVKNYCREVNMSSKVEKRKTYAVRSFIYGAAVLINSGALPYNDQTICMIEQCIDREFNIE